MAFPVKDWKDAPTGWTAGDPVPAGATPLDAAALEDLEQRLAAYAEARSALGPNLVAPFDPRLIAGLSPMSTANDLRMVRVTVPKTGTLRDLAVYVGASGGNIAGAVYSTAAQRARLWSSGAVATPAANGWRIIGDPALAVDAGDELDFALSADNTTATFGRIVLPNAALSVLPAGFWPADGAQPKLAGVRAAAHPPPATIDEANVGQTTLILALIARVE